MSESLTPRSMSSRIRFANFCAPEITRCDSTPTFDESQSGWSLRTSFCTVLIFTDRSDTLSDFPSAMRAATAAESSSSSLIERSCG